jgi:hypothetical protein
MSTSFSLEVPLKVVLKVDVAPMVGEGHGNKVSVAKQEDGRTMIARCEHFTGDIRISLIGAPSYSAAFEALSLGPGLAHDDLIEDSPRSGDDLQARSSDDEEEESWEAPTSAPAARRHVGFARTTRAASRRSEQVPVSAVAIASDTEGEEEVDDDLSDAFQETQEESF